METKEIVLQRLCRSLLRKVQGVAQKHGLSKWLNDMIEANQRGECVATIDEVDALSRFVNEERINQKDIPVLLGISYRTFFDNDIMKGIRKFKRRGSYSLNDAILLKETKYTNEKNPSLFDEEQ